MDNAVANNAIIGADRTSVIATDTVGIFFKVFIPATDMAFKLHYDPDIFELVVGSLECSFTQYFMDTNTISTVIVPFITIVVDPAQISYSTAQRMKDDTDDSTN